MGLDTSHNCWHGAYSAFHRWRIGVARCIGIDLEQMAGFENGAMSWSQVIDPLKHLLYHSDCDGELEPEVCGPIADRLEAILPLLPNGDGGGHIGDWRKKTQQFIDGLRKAAAAGEAVEFH